MKAKIAIYLKRFRAQIYRDVTEEALNLLNKIPGLETLAGEPPRDKYFQFFQIGAKDIIVYNISLLSDELCSHHYKDISMFKKVYQIITFQSSTSRS